MLLILHVICMRSRLHKYLKEIRKVYIVQAGNEHFLSENKQKQSEISAEWNPENNLIV